MTDICTCAHQLQPHARLTGVCPPLNRDDFGCVPGCECGQGGPPLDEDERMSFEKRKLMTFTDEDPSVGHEHPVLETY